MQILSHAIRTVTILLLVGQILALCPVESRKTGRADGPRVSTSEGDWIGGALCPEKSGHELMAQADEGQEVPRGIHFGPLPARHPTSAMVFAPKTSTAVTLVSQSVLLLA